MNLVIGRDYVYMGTSVVLKDLEDGRAHIFSWETGHKWVDVDRLGNEV